MERGFARPGADLGADSGADFIFEMRAFRAGLDETAQAPRQQGVGLSLDGESVTDERVAPEAGSGEQHGQYLSNAATASS